MVDSSRAVPAVPDCQDSEGLPLDLSLGNFGDGGNADHDAENDAGADEIEQGLQHG